MATDHRFTTQDVITITGTTRARLHRWQRAGLIHAADGGHYSLDTLINVAQLSILADIGLPLASIRKVEAAYRARLDAVPMADRTMVAFVYYSRQVRAAYELGLDPNREPLYRIAALVNQTVSLPTSPLDVRVGQLLEDILDVPVPSRYMN